MRASPFLLYALEACAGIQASLLGRVVAGLGWQAGEEDVVCHDGTSSNSNDQDASTTIAAPAANIPGSVPCRHDIAAGVDGGLSHATQVHIGSAVLAAVTKARRDSPDLAARRSETVDASNRGAGPTEARAGAPMSITTMATLVLLVLGLANWFLVALFA